MNESLSALLDGECSPSELDRLLAELDRDPELRRQFSRLCLARDGRMGIRVRSAELDFADRVLAALHTEEPRVVVAIGDRIRRLPWRMAASLAAAAVVGAATVLAVRPDPAGMPVAQPAIPAAGTLTAQQDSLAAEGETGFAELDDENARQLRNYLIAYSQSRGQVGSTMGYARYAAYTDDQPATAQTTELKR
ncbi:MAG: sigma-E factor negative regulatory protein [Gammaproteobacteria bacterium]